MSFEKCKTCKNFNKDIKNPICSKFYFLPIDTCEGKYYN